MCVCEQWCRVSAELALPRRLSAGPAALEAVGLGVSFVQLHAVERFLSVKLFLLDRVGRAWGSRVRL